MSFLFKITDYEEAEDILCSAHTVTHVVSLNDTVTYRWDPDRMLSVPSAHGPCSPPKGLDSVPEYQRLVLHFDDLSDPHPGFRVPDEHDVRKIAAFAQGLGTGANVLFHCAAGISRSTAAAFIVLCAHRPMATESGMLDDVLNVRPQAYPNRRMIALADRLMGRNGRMVRACEDKLKHRFWTAA